MTKLEAIRIMLEIVTECDKQSGEGGSCKNCPFGRGNSCMASEGNDIPAYWHIKDMINCNYGE